VDYLAQAIESISRMLLPTFAAMKCVYLVDHFLAAFSGASELPAIALANILAACAQPDSFIFEIGFLVIVEMTAIKVVLAPPIIVISLCAFKVSQTQARLGPPEIIL
jgi:hypothetical protein